MIQLTIIGYVPITTKKTKRGFRTEVLSLNIEKTIQEAKAKAEKIISKAKEIKEIAVMLLELSIESLIEKINKLPKWFSFTKQRIKLSCWRKINKLKSKIKSLR